MPKLVAQYDGTEALLLGSNDRKRAYMRLGHSVDPNISLDEAMIRTRSNDEVTPKTLYAQTDDAMVEIETHQCVYSDMWGPMGIHSPSYAIMQRREILDIALDIAGLTKGDARVDTIGNIGSHGEKFFAFIKFNEFVIDPNGVADEMEQGLYVATSYDGTLPNIIGYGTTRIECLNELRMVLKGLTQTINVKHTRNAESRIQQAAQALQWVGAVETQLKDKAEQMLAVKDGDAALVKLLDHFYPVDDKSLGDNAKTRRMRERGEVRMLFEGEDNTNVDRVGRNGWAAYNAFTEYLDHFKGVRGREDKDTARAERSFFPGKISDQKIVASKLILAS